MQRLTAAPHEHRRSAARLRCVLAGLLIATMVAAAMPPASAVGPTQRLLCDGYTAGTCAITAGSVAANGQILTVDVKGNAGVDVALQFYAIDFNSQGEIAGLVPSGPVELVTGNNALSGIKMVPRTLVDVPGGWGFVGLADDDSIDLRTRLGQVVELGGRTLKLLGDGYAEQKPVGIELELHTLGNVYGIGYWIEYLADDGEWTALPGHGYGQSQRLRTSPGEISHLTYTVPESLNEGQPYQFRVNHHMNYEGGASRPIAAPAFAEWTVVPSEHGQAKARGAQLDTSKAPGRPDADDSEADDTTAVDPTADEPAPSGSSAEPRSDSSTAPSTAPSAPESDTTEPDSSGPEAEVSEAEPSGEPASSPSSSPSESQAAEPSASVAPSPSSAPSAGPSAGPSSGASTGPSPSPSNPAAGAAPGGTVWGAEAGVVPAARVQATGAPVRWGVGALLLVLALTPLGIRVLQRRVPTTKESW